MARNKQFGVALTSFVVKDQPSDRQKLKLPPSPPPEPKVDKRRRKKKPATDGYVAHLVATDVLVSFS